MSHYNEYTFDVKEVIFPEGAPQFQSGHATAARKFVMSCENAEEFVLRMLGKFYMIITPSLTPYLPAPYPFDETGDRTFGKFNLVARSFKIDPISACTFITYYLDLETDEVEKEYIKDPTDIDQMGRWFFGDRVPGIDDSESACFVTIGYEENPCDCIYYDPGEGDWIQPANVLQNTCLSAERNPAYEMFTLPNGGLVWEGITGSDAQLKADSYAYKVIPKADIIVHWHNVPVNKLCQIQGHLAKYRGCVNNALWGSILSCDNDSSYPPEDECDEDANGCRQYEPETILFIDWQEDRSQRTDAFGGIRNIGQQDNRNTTTLKLNFKQKRVYVPADLTDAYTENDVCVIAGWNHLFLDRTNGPDVWKRVLVESTGDPIFTLKSFTDIFNPTL